ncbi:MAG: hypothetical protein KAW09_06280 [Thermoplasmata archaeon]|nr:hypothetical protein [Thermoplasmata archaeon]
MSQTHMQEREKLKRIRGEPGHWVVLVDDEVFATDEDGNKILDLAEEMGKADEYKGREVSVFWIFDTPSVFY